ncbi:uncharacterized protein LOC128558925 [Mercenaria mercenaria]|uniref:uncharacterized protein LOC128558925 n=1 Tax=Mercenaria mercenaria TaxID=6596 RepID=UPI00234F26EC|nr:uncharacterized protein LOC128558925 [Mercenaria mercenaria]
MFHQPGYIEDVSVRLSEVLADIGVDERIVTKRRRTWLLMESICSISLQLQDKKATFYNLGSNSEGTTTEGLSSDIDQLFCYNDFNVIQDWCDWKPGVSNYLMIQDETVSPGYCLLQRLRDDAPLPYNDVLNEVHFRDRTGRILFNEVHFRDRTGRILLGNTFHFALATHIFKKAVRHGPAFTREAVPGYADIDFVVTFPCKSWPLQARQWLDSPGQWPSDDIRRYCSNTGCFVVPVGSKGSEHEELEWRVSTCLAERCLMFNLNITQIRCYVLMKMVLKTFFKQPLFEDTISSFVCKTVLFHCIANTHSNIWRENNLLVCLSLNLFVLYHSILNENCTHFIISGNNLMRGKISPQVKPYILEILLYIINSEETALLEIGCDDLGSRLLLKLLNSLFTFKKSSELVSGSLVHASALITNENMDAFLCPVINSSNEEAIIKFRKYIFNLVMIYNQCQGVERTACHHIASWFCTTLGSTLASLNIQQYRGISAEALSWISLGLNTDVSSSKLKLASMFYCIGDSNRTDIVLRDIEGSYDKNIVEPICNCHNYIRQAPRRGFNAISDNHNEEAIQNITASCVRFLPHEINCIPTELQYEILRSTQDDMASRGLVDYWMDCAVVDSLPYLYFLQYKTYSHLERQNDKQEALSNLVRTIDQEPNLGHRETALNLLGQCMEQEHRARDALHCYLKSLNLRERNNAARIHICRLLSNLANNQ